MWIGHIVFWADYLTGSCAVAEPIKPVLNSSVIDGDLDLRRGTDLGVWGHVLESEDTFITYSPHYQSLSILLLTLKL